MNSIQASVGTLKTTESRRFAVQRTIIGFYKACHRSLSEELALKSKLEFQRIDSCLRPGAMDETLTWAQFLANLSHLLPFMTIREHRFVCRLISLCILSYFTPQATSSPFRDKTHDNNISDHHDNVNSPENTVVEATTEAHGYSYDIDQFEKNMLTLEQFLEGLHHFHTPPPSSSIFNPFMLQDDDMLSSYWTFLNKGLGPFLASRPLPFGLSHEKLHENNSQRQFEGEMDLLHVLAMAIAPEIPLSLPPPANDDDDTSYFHKSSPYLLTKKSFSSRAHRFMFSSTQIYTFHCSYSQRAQLVNVLATSLILPNLSHISKSQLKEEQHDDWFDIIGGFMHLRAALHVFSISAFARINPNSVSSAGKHKNIATSQGASTKFKVESEVENFLAKNSFIDILNARIVLVNSAVDLSIQSFVVEEMKYLVHLIINDNNFMQDYVNDFHCWRSQACHPVPGNNRSFGCYNILRRYNSEKTVKQLRFSSLGQRIARQEGHGIPQCTCMHCINRDLLLGLILRHNGSRHDVDTIFTRRTLAELTCAIATTLEDIVKGESHSDRDVSSQCLENGDKSPITPCQVSSILDCARVLFMSLHSTSSCADPNDRKYDVTASDRNQYIDEGQQHEDIMKDALIGCSIQLLQSPDKSISSSASLLLSIAVTRSDLKKKLEYGTRILGVMKLKLQTSKMFGEYKEIIAAMSRFSLTFASSAVTIIIDAIKLSNSNDRVSVGTESLWHFISSVSLIQPKSILRHIDTLQELCENEKEYQKHFIAIVMSSQLAFSLKNEERAERCENIALHSINRIEEPWSIFQLGRHALCTSNFEVAKEIFQKKLSVSTLTYESFLWYTVLGKIAEAESVVSCDGSNAIPSALLLLESSASTIQFLSAKQLSIALQVELLQCRKDFFLLCQMTHSFNEESRLLDSNSKLARDEGHLRSLSRCFFKLACRYSDLNFRFGMFHCHQTRLALRIQFVVCKFLAIAVKHVFSEVHQKKLSPFDTEDFNSGFLDTKGYSNHPIHSILQKLKSTLVEPMSEYVAVKIRSEIMAQILQIILKCPIPLPRGFMTLKVLPTALVKISTSPNEHPLFEDCDFGADDLIEEEFDAEILDVPEANQFKLDVNGFISQEIFEKSKIFFSHVVVRFCITFDGPKDEKVEEVETEEEEEESLCMKYDTAEPLPLFPSITSTDSSGREISGSKFLGSVKCQPICKEGYYKVEVQLVARDVSCGECEIPLAEDAGIAFLLISCNHSQEI